MPEIATGLAARFATAALSRFGISLIRQIARDKKIDSALSGKPQRIEQELVIAAQNEITRVIAAYRGELTIGLDEFLKELLLSGVSSGIVSCAIVGRIDPNLQSRFDALYKDHGLPEEHRQRFFGDLSEAFRTAIIDRVNDKALLLIVQNIAGELFKGFEKIARPTEHLLNVESPLKTTPDFQSLLSAVARSLRSHFQDIDVRTVQGIQKIPIDQIYVTQTIRYEREDVQDEAGGVSGPPIVYVTSDREDDATANLEFLLEAENKSVVLGFPGGGKSTLIQQLCYRMAVSLISHLEDQPISDGALLAKAPRFPVRVTLREFESARNQKPDLTLIEFMALTLADIVHRPKDLLRNLVHRWLEFGELFVAFDGLDEILQIDKRKQFSQVVADFCSAYPLNRYVVTSRIVGYREAPLPKDFTQGELQDFSVQQSSRYVHAFMRTVQKLPAEQARTETRKFLAATEKHGLDLRSNPLMLQLMCSLYFARQGDIPENRPDIYRECAELMFHRWDRSRGIRPHVRTNFELMELLTFLASRIYGNAQLETGTSAEWLSSEMRQFFEKHYEDRAVAIEATNEVREFITGRAWVMTDVAPNRFRFTHRTFLEFFFARFLANREDTIAQFLQASKKSILSREQIEPIHLALQMKAFDSRRRTEVFEELQRLVHSAAHVEQKMNALVFSAEVLGYLPLAERECKLLTMFICIEVNKAVQLGRLVALYAIEQLAETSQQRRDVVWTTVVEYCLDCARDANLDRITVMDRLIWRNYHYLGVWHFSRSYGSNINAGQFFQHLRKKIVEERPAQLTAALEGDQRKFPLRWRWLSPNRKEILSALSGQGLWAFVPAKSEQMQVPRIGLLEHLSALLVSESMPQYGAMGWLDSEKLVQTLHALSDYATGADTIVIESAMPIGFYLPLGHQLAFATLNRHLHDKAAVVGLYVAAYAIMLFIKDKPSSSVPGKQHRAFWLRAENFGNSKFREVALESIGPVAESIERKFSVS